MQRRENMNAAQKEVSRADAADRSAKSKALSKFRKTPEYLNLQTPEERKLAETAHVNELMEMR